MVAHSVVYQEVLGYARERAASGKGEAKMEPLLWGGGQLAIRYQSSDALYCPHDLPLWAPATMFVQKDPITLDQG